MYRTGWLAACIALLLVGVGAAVHASPQTFPFALLVGALACSLWRVGAVRPRRSVGPRRVCARIVATSALVGGIVAVALVGLVGLLGHQVALLGVFVVVSSPPAARTYGRWIRSDPGPSAAGLDAVARVVSHVDMGYVGIQFPAEPRALTDEQLCQRWRVSCLYLRRRPSAAQVMREVERRQTYLDEFERRSPGGYAAWLTSGAGTVDDLTPPYVVGCRSRHDQLGRSDPQAELMSASRSRPGHATPGQGHRSSIASPRLVASGSAARRWHSTRDGPVSTHAYRRAAQSSGTPPSF
jgi:hypothetical protein